MAVAPPAGPRSQTAGTGPSAADRIKRIPDPGEPVPRIALPTVALLAGSLAVAGTATALGVTGSWPWPLTTLVNAVAGFVAFTVAHDASHNSISTSPRATAWIGRVATAMFTPIAGFKTFRFIHMQHHRFTNEHDGRDPDMYTHDAPAWQLPLRWLSVDAAYLRFYVRHVRSRARSEQLELLATWLVLGGALLALALAGHAVEVLLFYLLPSRLAIAFLAWSFDYLPHHGLEGQTASANRFRATRNRVGLEWLLSPLLLNQNYHLVHHLHPVIPFYRYVRVWRRGEAAYLENDPALSTASGRPLTAEEYRRLRELADHHH